MAITCPAGVIRVVSAAWGRTDEVTCQAPNMGNTNCRADAAIPVGNKCAGKPTCTLNGNNDDFTNPCPGVQKYLNVVYQCVEVQNLADSELVDPLNDPLADPNQDLATQDPSNNDAVEAHTSVMNSPVFIIISVITILVVVLVLAGILYYVVARCKKRTN